MNLLSISTRDIPSNEKAEFWNHLVAGHLLDANSSVEFNPSVVIEGSINVHAFHQTKIVNVRSPKSTVVRDKGRVNKAEDEFVLALFNKSGRAVFRQCGRSTLLAAGDFALYDSIFPHTLKTSGDFVCDVVRVPRSEFILRIPNLTRIVALKANANDGLGAVAAAFVEHLQSEKLQIDCAQRTLLSEALIDTLATCAYELEPNLKGSELSSSGTAQLERIKFYTLREMRKGKVSAETVAKTHKISERYLNKLLQAEGMSFSRWVRYQRCMWIASELSKSTNSAFTISEIAFRCGFNSLSYFNRVFKEQYGFSPTEYRFLNNEAASDL